MLESGIFRFMMLIGGVIVMAALVAGLFYVPMADVEIGSIARDNYETMMDVTLDEDKDWLSLYEVVWFSLKSMIRGDVTYY